MREETVQEARERILENRLEGSKCPVCGSFVRVYARQISGKMGADLIALHNSGPGVRHYSDFIDGHPGDFAKLRYWGLIRGVENDDPTKRDSGSWELTGAGNSFIHNRLMIPRRLYVFRGTSLGPEDERDEVSIVDVLGVKFNYAELMKQPRIRTLF